MLFRSIPLLGTAFKQKRQVATKSELVILLKPIIADDSAWESAINESKRRITNLREEIEPSVFR